MQSNRTPVLSALCLYPSETLSKSEPELLPVLATSIATHQCMSEMCNRMLGSQGQCVKTWLCWLPHTSSTAAAGTSTWALKYACAVYPRSVRVEIFWFHISSAYWHTCLRKVFSNFRETSSFLSVFLPGRTCLPACLLRLCLQTSTKVIISACGHLPTIFCQQTT